MSVTMVSGQPVAGKACKVVRIGQGLGLLGKTRGGEVFADVSLFFQRLLLSVGKTKEMERSRVEEDRKVAGLRRREIECCSLLGV